MAVVEDPGKELDPACPWRNEEVQRLVNLILSSHQRAFNQPLLINTNTQLKRSGLLQNSQRLFSAGFPVLAHDGGNDPLLTYANGAALKLWHRPWNLMIGMPSRLTAPAGERQARSRALSSARQLDAIKGYHGIRINSKGQIFEIKDARIWTVWNREGKACGQAASFEDWSLL